MIHSGCIQESPTLNLVGDYLRFVITFFEAINVSAPHIYHSALLLSPRTSITYEMHKQHAHPLARVVQGIPVSWEVVAATANFDEDLDDVAWSPCNRFIAVANPKFVEVFDAVTLSRLSIFDHSYAGRGQLLGFSPDSRCLTLFTSERLINWDLQTGGPLGIILSRLDRQYMRPFSFKHSEDGKVVAVAYRFPTAHNNDQKHDTFICTYDLLSGEHVGSRHVPKQRMIYPIWSHDEYLRFATINLKLITIWQSPFSLEHPPVEVTSLPIPDGITDANGFLFLPSLSRLAFILEGTIQVWDVKTSNLLLKSEFALDRYGLWNPIEDDLPCSSFSSDGRFFAYTNTAREFHVWKESPTGYLLHQQLPFFFSLSRPRLSPNSESIIALLRSKIYQWHTRNQSLSLPRVLGNGRRSSDFTLGFSLDMNFAAFAQRDENTVTIIDLQSGELKWSADMGVEIRCLGMAGSTVIAVGRHSIVTWNLPGRDRTFNASINNIVRTTFLHHSPPSPSLGKPKYVSISPDLSRIVIARGWSYSLEVDDVTTGSCLTRITTKSPLRPLFTRDGREVWASRDGIHSEKLEQCEIIEDGESGAIELKLQTIPRQSRGFPQESSHGYTITDGGWVLSPSQKRLLWLPHRWRLCGRYRAWGGRFLGLLYGDLSEVVILEFLE